MFAIVSSSLSLERIRPNSRPEAIRTSPFAIAKDFFGRGRQLADIDHYCILCSERPGLVN
jgi:hypothetical protein